MIGVCFTPVELNVNVKQTYNRRLISFQWVHPNSTLYVAFQVLRGGDGMAGFAVKHPNGNVVHPYAWKAQSDYQETAAVGGYYAVCVDNQFSRFAAKLINLYITTFR